MLKISTFICLMASVLAGPTRHTIPHLDGRIVGGSDTIIEDYPYQVSVLVLGSHICGGSILSEYWVLTAAHCIIYVPSAYSVRAGSSTINSGGSVHAVESNTRHSSYNGGTYDYDIAVMRVVTPFVFGLNVATVGLTSEVPESGATAIATGWGATSEGGPAATNLQYVEVPIVSNTQCTDSYPGGITDRMVCAGYTNGGRDACQGDSGGPLVVGGVQVGIVSWGYGCARPSYPGVYASVANLRSWIRSATGV